MPHTLTETEESKLRNSFRRCSEDTLNAIFHFRREKDIAVVPTIVYGIIQRYLSAESTAKVAEMPSTTRLIEDLGIDSLTMLEVVLSIEEALLIRIENEELMQIRTLGDVREFIEQKISRGDSVDPESNVASRKLTREEILLTLPHQPPFLFIDSAVIEGDTIRATYRVTGDEYFLEGHFKDQPIFPASIVFEAMGQAACLWILSSAQAKLGHALDSQHVLFGSMESAHFHRKAKPGDILEFEANLHNMREPLAIFDCKGTVGGQKLATVEKLVIVFGSARQMECTQQHESCSVSETVEEDSTLPKL